MERGFFHPDRGYWQTVADVQAEILNGYPEGTVEVPLKPSGDHTWDGSAWVVQNAPAPTSEQVKAEAYRRIIAIVPEWKQRNLTAQAAVLAEKGRANWTPEETAAWDAGSAIWARIAAIRAASDDIEAIDPIPSDFTDNSYWPE